MLVIGRHHLAILGMDGRCDHGLTAAGDAHRHTHGLGRAGRPVVHAGVGHVHAGQLGDHGLELENCLQRSLGDLGLVRRIAGEKLAALHQGIDDHRAVMAIGPCAQKAGVIGGVFLAGGAKIVDDFALGHLAGNVQVAVKPVFGGDDGKQVVDGGRTNVGKHLFPLSGRFWQVTHF